MNIFFIALIFIAPVGYCLYDTTIPTEVGRTVIVISFLLAAFVIADWYHFYSSNTFYGAFGAIGFGAVMMTISLVVTAMVTGASIVELATFENHESRGGLNWLLRFYVAGMGVFAAAIVGVVRLIVIRGLGGSDLPMKTEPQRAPFS